MQNQKYDVIIIGAGPIGLACGIEAEKKKKKYLIIEKGCLVNSLFNYPTNMTFFSTSERLEIGGVPFISHGPKPTRSEALEYYRRVREAWKLNVHLYEAVKNVSGRKGLFKVTSEHSTYTAKNIIVSTGFYDHPNLLNIPGEDLLKVKHYYDEPHPYINQKVLVVGGGNSGIDVALETFRHGSEVTMVLKKAQIDRGVKYWVRPDIENRIEEGSIKAYFKSKLAAVREKEVDIKTPEGIVTIENDFVLAMTGYHPDFSFLSKLGIELNGGVRKIPRCNEETFETNVPGIFCAGVVCGGMETSKWFIENSIYHAERIFMKL